MHYSFIPNFINTFLITKKRIIPLKFCSKFQCMNKYFKSFFGEMLQNKVYWINEFAHFCLLSGFEVSWEAFKRLLPLSAF